MKEASNDFNGPVKKPVGLGSGRIFKLIVFELAKQRKQMAGEKGAMGWTIKGSPAATWGNRRIGHSYHQS